MKSVAGSLESSDAMVVVEESEKELEIEMEGIDKIRFRDTIENIAKDIVNKKKVKNIKITINDRGAINATISARIETALNRYMNLKGVRN